MSVIIPATEIRRGPKILLYGPPGSGKTHALRTLIDAGYILFVIHTEFPGMEVLADLPADKYHYMYIPPTTGTWDAFIKRAEKLNTMSWEVLKTMTNDPQKADYTGFLKFLGALNNFTCARTGEQFGDVSTWPDNYALAVDSLSGVNTLCMQATIGNPIARSMSQWGAAMGMELSIIDKLCLEVPGPFVLTAHPDRFTHETSGAYVVRPSALGQANAPEIPKQFSDMIYTVREGDKFKWSTIAPSTETKARNVLHSDAIPPSFVNLIQKWKAGAPPASGTSPSAS